MHGIVRADVETISSFSMQHWNEVIVLQRHASFLISTDWLLYKLANWPSACSRKYYNICHNYVAREPDNKVCHVLKIVCGCKTPSTACAVCV